MQQHTTGVAFVATHLAHTDRRALSEAWYSALHLAGDAHRAATPNRSVARRPVAAKPAPGARVERVHATGVTPPRAARDAGRATARHDVAAVTPERRAAKTPLASRIAAALNRRAACAGARSFAVATADGRIHVVVRSDGARTRIVAVCTPSLRERVERALAQARFALAGHGLNTEAAR
ncbi:MAG TPA: hypothetical protein VGC96_03895 [Candidatus Elarobacter sp.]